MTPNPMTGICIKVGSLDIATDRERTLCDGGGRDWRDTSANQGKARIAGKCLQPGKRHRADFPLRRNQSC